MNKNLKRILFIIIYVFILFGVLISISYIVNINNNIINNEYINTSISEQNISVLLIIFVCMGLIFLIGFLYITTNKNPNEKSKIIYNN